MNNMQTTDNKGRKTVSRSSNNDVVKRSKTELPEFTGIQDPKKPITSDDLWNFVKEHAGNNEHNVEIVPLDNIAHEADRPLPFSNMKKGGPRSKILWNLVNGCGETGDRRLSTYLDESRKHRASRKRCEDLIAALNGGYSSSARTWGTPFVKLRVIPNKDKKSH